MNPTKRLICECEVKDIESGNFYLKYYMLSTGSGSCFSGKSEDSIVYGISIRKFIMHHGSIICTEEESVAGFSYCPEEVVEQINILAGMQVTPLSLLYIVDDYLSKP